MIIYVHLPNERNKNYQFIPVLTIFQEKKEKFEKIIKNNQTILSDIHEAILQY